MNAFTPEDVLAKYKKLGLKPVFGSFSADQDGDMRVAAFGGECCALTLMTLGEKWGEAEDVPTIAARKFGFIDGWSFVWGFDGQEENKLPYPVRDRDAYDLGKACREAVKQQLEAKDLSGEDE